MENEVDTRTLTVELFPGHPREVTKEEFVDIWMEQTREFRKLVRKFGDWDFISELQQWTRTQAEEIFEDLWKRRSAENN